ncbi:MAG: hypothetical protein QOE51_1255 [Actinoplanes sp.]|jgi:hypothetical protein|nr:hypothetical protein [Actinoplanes sp.]
MTSIDWVQLAALVGSLILSLVSLAFAATQLRSARRSTKIALRVRGQLQKFDVRNADDAESLFEILHESQHPDHPPLDATSPSKTRDTGTLPPQRAPRARRPEAR